MCNINKAALPCHCSQFLFILFLTTLLWLFLRAQIRCFETSYCIDSMGHTNGGSVETGPCHRMGGNQVEQQQRWRQQSPRPHFLKLTVCVCGVCVWCVCSCSASTRPTSWCSTTSVWPEDLTTQPLSSHTVTRTRTQSGSISRWERPTHTHIDKQDWFIIIIMKTETEMMILAATILWIETTRQI